MRQRPRRPRRNGVLVPYGRIVLVGRAVTHAKPSDPGFYKNLLRQAVRFTIVIESLVNLYVFPFVIELILMPIILLFIGLQVVAAYDPAQAPVRKVIDGVASSALTGHPPGRTVGATPSAASFGGSLGTAYVGPGARAVGAGLGLLPMRAST